MHKRAVYFSLVNLSQGLQRGLLLSYLSKVLVVVNRS